MLLSLMDALSIRESAVENQSGNLTCKAFRLTSKKFLEKKSVEESLHRKSSEFHSLHH
jgi:hypothetical protein